MKRLSKRGGLIVAGLIGLNGGLLMASLLVSEGGAPGMAERSLLVLFAFLGAFLAGLAVLSFFGKGGAGGWALAAMGAVLATGMGGAIGGGLFTLASVFTYEAPGWGIFLEMTLILKLSVMLVFMALAKLTTFGVWALLMALTHVVARRLRRSAENLHGHC